MWPAKTPGEMGNNATTCSTGSTSTATVAERPASGAKFTPADTPKEGGTLLSVYSSQISHPQKYTGKTFKPSQVITDQQFGPRLTPGPVPTLLMGTNGSVPPELWPNACVLLSNMLRYFSLPMLAQCAMALFWCTILKQCRFLFISLPWCLTQTWLNATPLSAIRPSLLAAWPETTLPSKPVVPPPLLVRKVVLVVDKQILDKCSNGIPEQCILLPIVGTPPTQIPCPLNFFVVVVNNTLPWTLVGLDASTLEKLPAITILLHLGEVLVPLVHKQVTFLWLA